MYTDTLRDKSINHIKGHKGKGMCRQIGKVIFNVNFYLNNKVHILDNKVCIIVLPSIWF